MAYELKTLALDADELRRRIDDLLETQQPRYRRLWLYYRNPMLPRLVGADEQGSDRPYRQAQEWGLPSRITGATTGMQLVSPLPVDGVARKEVVVENDIAWRIDAMIDFLFGKNITIESLAADETRRAQIQSLLEQIIQNNGGATLLQQLALLGAVYGFVDVLVKFVSDDPATDAAPASTGNGEPPLADSLPPSAESASCLEISRPLGASSPASQDASPERIARMIRLEVVEPARALPVLSENDWRDVQAYVQVYRIRRQSGELRSPAKSRWSRLFAQLAAVRSTADDQKVTITELLTANAWQRYEDETLVAEGRNSLGKIPLVHIQNLAVPLEYSGNSDVEPLIPLQDELNTRLSDRANRITMQSFKMYLGKGIENFTNQPVAPGRMWSTENMDAEVIEFGGEASSPSEDRHITELREAMDKTSSVTPIAAGAIRGRVGNLTSAAALRVTMMALLAKTQRKRTTYGQGISRMCELALEWLDHAGVFKTTADERRVKIQWPGMLHDFSAV